MSDAPGPSEATPVRRRWPYFLGLLALAVVVAIGVYLDLVADRELQAVLAETDQLGPRWRLEDVEADRAVVPDDKNSGTVVVAAKVRMPKRWPFEPVSDIGADGPHLGKGVRQLREEGFQGLEPVRQQADEQTTALRKEMNRAAEALAEARKLADLPQGRYPITYRPDWISTQIPHISEAGEIASLLAYDAMLRAQDKNLDGALASCRGVLNAGRTIGDEPLLVSQVARLACAKLAVNQAERVLAQGEPSEDALRQFQELVKKEEREGEALFLIACRGERAGWDRLIEAVQSGKLNISHPREVFVGHDDYAHPRIEEVLRWTPGFIRSQRAALLRYQNQVVELAKLPPEQRRVPFQRLEATLKDQPVYVRCFTPAWSKISDAFLVRRAQLRCAIAVIAAERYRRARGRWPDTLDALADAGLLPETPTDPFDGQPLRLRWLDDGLVIYSIGTDGVDDRGKIDRQNPIAPETDIGVRLWDAAKRCQPPASFKPPPDAGK